ncbi:rho guanine nucleotide exchange factor 1 isoform X1 [Monodelphis domestica]|uniref:rho guanine nucleotide exchange factor 1 isoform X1 n=1 Tax=Monodelphis domestica TaxID=13616 RepID=UPI0024E21A26|nr:rho guanine nucleotide exchange factor 1 isoform X1 [Monodelphis domestica]XP_056652987.1 rho guanine nucleotide exchange factor 1 isoform X1 [Monodelphis domestica]XP_056652988.1 rho guanine nucleotide exchange factor 1 isoform X1 [Monodelphis domestica]XP_056652989.1 rho guanine nucleotide exchange factor 1 isoform X1 [Monodelphis domestica]XP_056652990.1 rho guanine nucleotide exchange factor 1 isoform X1 [Monodelphis domestica]XP_056652991.1 rho guanine nucleotide exchange factor 1 isof
MEMEDAARGAPGPTRPAPVSIIGAEDEDFENELEAHPEERSSEFQSLEQVKRRPAHLMAFLHHVALQFEPGPLLCCLHADMLTMLGSKEAKKGFQDFYHNFLEKTAVLRVPVPSSVSFELDRTRPELLPEDVQRRFVQEVVQAQQSAICRQLEDFRSKRLMGMTPGEPELSQLEAWAARDRVSFEGRERLVAERLLTRLEDIHPTISTDEEKSVAIVSAISSYMRYLGVRTKGSDKKARGNFFRKKNRRADDAPKSKKGLSSILDAARWNRGEAQAPDSRHPKAESDGEKPGLPERKTIHVTPPRGVVGPPGLDAPGVTVHPPPGESPDKEPGTDPPQEVGDPPPQGPSNSETPVLPESNPEDGGDTESPEPGDDGEPGRAGLELEPEEPLSWRELVPPDTLNGMQKNQVKRQEVISELLVTEAAHVRMLRVLHDLFYQPMADGGFFTMAELQNIFPSLDELIDVHSLFLESLMKLRQESGHLIEDIGDVLLARFHGPEGAWFQKISSRFCSRQSFALEQLKAKQRKDPRFCAFVQEAESRPLCRRLQLKDMIPTEMQRLTKYPLLLQSIWQNTEEEEEKKKVEQAAECCKDILHHVNQSVRDMEDFLRLKDYQRRLDLSQLRQSNDPMLSEFKNLDITKKRLVHEGTLTWRVTKDKAVEVHVLLLDDLLLLLQRQDERLILKSHSRTLTPTPDGKTMLRPVLRLTSAMTREVATDHRAFYVIFTWDQEAHIYELVAQTVSERKNWCTLITDTAGSLKVPAPPGRPRPRPSPTSAREPLNSISENGGSGSGSGSGSGRDAPQQEASRSDRILSDLLPFSCPGPEGQLATAALQEVQSLKRILLPPEENGSGPRPEGDGVPGAALGPAAMPELRERLLNLEENVKKLEEVEEELCRLRLVLSQLQAGSPTQSGCS